MDICRFSAWSSDFSPLGFLNVFGTLRVPRANGTRSVPDTFSSLDDQLGVELAVVF